MRDDVEVPGAMTRFLLCGVLTGAFLSADMAAMLGLQSVRILLFVLVVLALLAASVAEWPYVTARLKAVPVLLVGIFCLMVAGEVGRSANPLDYRMALPLLILLCAPNVAHALEGRDLPRLLWRMLALYAVVTAALSSPVARGDEHLVRLDFSGSLVSHSGLCAILLILTLVQLPTLRSDLARLMHLGVGLLAAGMLLLTATRTALATLVLAGVLLASTSANRSAGLRRLMVLLALGVLFFTVYTLLVSDAFFLRLMGPEMEDYSSGRLTSQIVWLQESLQHPLGLGLGAIRERLAEGRPDLDGQQLLEWPHNELIRFFVEGGVPGLAFVALLLGWLTCRALRAARRDSDGPRRALMMAIVADMLAQSMLQNYFNSIYHATSLLILLAVAILQAEDASAIRAEEGVQLPIPPLAGAVPHA